MAFAVFFLAEYANMILVSALAATMFLGGWLSPFEGIPMLGSLFAFVPGALWLVIKISFLLLFFLWFRATFCCCFSCGSVQLFHAIAMTKSCG